MAKFVPCERDQPYLLPPNMREWIPKEDLAHFVLESVELVKMDQFRINQRGTGSAQYEPRMMLALLIYCYAHGIFSSRRIERATWRDLGVRFITANQQPDHATIAKFRRENFAAVGECFLQVLLLAKELKILKLGTVSVDGTKLRAVNVRAGSGAGTGPPATVGRAYPQLAWPGLSLAPSQHKRFTASFKAPVAKEALRGDRTIQQTAAHHEVHPNQVSQWKRTASEGLIGLFEKRPHNERQVLDAEIQKLHAKIGQLVVERDSLQSAWER